MVSLVQGYESTKVSTYTNTSVMSTVPNIYQQKEHSGNLPETIFCMPAFLIRGTSSIPHNTKEEVWREARRGRMGQVLNTPAD